MVSRNDASTTADASRRSSSTRFSTKFSANSTPAKFIVDKKGGITEVTPEALKGKTIGKKSAKIHLDGYNFLPYLTGKTDKAPRKVFHYLNDEGFPVAVRIGDWKMTYAENRARTLALWAEPFVVLRMPKITNLRRDPFEKAEHNSNSYYDWMIDKAPYVYLGLSTTGQFLNTFKEYPPSQMPGSWSIEAVYKNVINQIK